MKILKHTDPDPKVVLGQVTELCLHVEYLELTVKDQREEIIAKQGIISILQAKVEKLNNRIRKLEDCPECSGYGVVQTVIEDYDLGSAESKPCPVCDGTGDSAQERKLK